ncbi:MAG: hypothetical protein ABI910_21520 [Gemmatimonadota bacterium]
MSVSMSALRSLGRSVRRVPVTLAVALLAAVAFPAQGQARPLRTLITINPLGLPFKLISAELEEKVNTFATIGASLSYIDIDHASYSSFEGKVRLYPNEQAFQGFAIGLGAGVTRIAQDNSDAAGGTVHDAKTVPSIAVLADYNWMLGKTKRVVVGTGVGAKRLFGSDKNFGSVNFAYPTARFQVGVVF